MFQRMKSGAVRFGVMAGALMSSVAAVAQTDTTTPAFADGPIVSSINGVAPIIIDVGGAVLAVVCVAWGFKVVRGFLGR